MKKIPLTILGVLVCLLISCDPHQSVAPSEESKMMGGWKVVTFYRGEPTSVEWNNFYVVSLTIFPNHTFKFNALGSTAEAADTTMTWKIRQDSITFKSIEDLGDTTVVFQTTFKALFETADTLILKNKEWTFKHLRQH